MASAFTYSTRCSGVLLEQVAVLDLRRPASASWRAGRAASAAPDRRSLRPSFGDDRGGGGRGEAPSQCTQPIDAGPAGVGG